MTEVAVAKSEGTTSFEVPYDITNLLALDGAKEVTVHGFKLVFNRSAIEEYLNANDATLEDLVMFVEKQISKEDAEILSKKQMKSRITGTTFSISSVGELSPEIENKLEVVVPKVRLDIEVVKSSIDAVINDDLTKYTTYLPPEDGSEIKEPIKCVTGHSMRSFLNSMQEPDSGLDINTQIKLYATLLTNLPDEDPTKLYGLTQMRMLMQYGDVVSNRNLRLSLTKLLEVE